MKRFGLSVVGPALLAVANALVPVPASALTPDPAQVQPRPRQLEGRIVQMGADHFVVRTRGNEQLTIHVRPQTRFLLRNRVVQFTDLRIGSDVTVVAVPERELQIADTVTLAGEEPPPDEGTLIEGEIVRVVGEDQVIVRTAERKEVTVFVDPRTAFLINDRPGRFVDLRAGNNVHVHVNLRDGRHMAHRVIVRPRHEK
jgi:hypothetical protein